MKKFDKPFRIEKRVNSPFSDIVKIKKESNGLGVLKAFIVFGIIAFQVLMFIIATNLVILSHTSSQKHPKLLNFRLFTS